jgi:hypothetical protein
VTTARIEPGERVVSSRAARGSTYRKATCGPASRFGHLPLKVAVPRRCQMPHIVRNSVRDRTVVIVAFIVGVLLPFVALMTLVATGWVD